MAQFHSLPSSQLPGPGEGISGDLYFAVDTNQLFVCATGYLLPVSGILSGGLSLNQTGPQGPQGTPGAPGQGLTWRGAWNTGNTYAPYDLVNAPDGSVYICTVENIHQQPPNTAFWNLFAAAPSGGGEVSSVGLADEPPQKEIDLR